MQVYAGRRDAHEPAERRRAGRGAAPPRRLPAADRGELGRRARAARARRDRRAAERGALPLVVGGTGLYLRAALTDLALPPVGAARRARRAGSGSTTSAGPRRRWRSWRDAIARAAGRLHANDRRRVVRGARARRARARASRPSATGCGPAGCAGRRSSRSSRGRAASCARASPSAPRRCSRAGPWTRCAALREARRRAIADRRAHPRPRRRSAPTSTGRATLDECAAEITLRTGQYARRQETWARRIPGAIELAGADGPERNADRLLELIR